METDLGNYLFAWTEAFEWIEHGLHRRHAARIEREPAGHHGGVGGQAACRPSGSLEAVERISELLDLSGLFSALAASSQRQEEPVLHGGHPSQRT